MADKNHVYLFHYAIPGKILGGKAHDFNSINGGIVKTADMGIVSTNFWGGSVTHFGFIKEYGFYACPSRFDNEIIGFYVHDPEKITKLGRKVLEDRFPGKEIVYGPEPAKTVNRAAEEAKRQKLIAEFEALGGPGIQVRTANAEEIAGLIVALRSGPSNAKMAVPEDIVETTMGISSKVQAPQMKGKPPKAVMDSLTTKARGV